MGSKVRETMGRMSLMSTLVASLLFVALMVAPLWFADTVESGELDAFALGISSTPYAGLETEEDIPVMPILEAPVAISPDGDARWECKDGAVFHKASQASNLQTNISAPMIFGESYGSFVIDTDGAVGDTNQGTFGSSGWCLLSIRYNVTKADLVNADVISHMITTSGNFTWDFVGIAAAQYDAAGVLVNAIELNDRLDYTTYSDATQGAIPITTTKKLLMDGTFPDVLPAGNFLTVAVSYFEDVDENFPQDTDIVIHDLAIEGERDGLLSNQNKLITFNIAYVLIGGLLVIIATPWVSWDQLFGAVKGGRPGKKGAMGGMSMWAVVVLAVAALGAYLIFGGGGSFTTVFSASLLPLSLAIFGVLLVAMTTKGQSNKGFSFVMGALAAVMGWFLGTAVQGTWLPFDKVYVAPFVEVVSGNVGLTSVFELSAFFVVVVQILGVLVALYNIALTFSSDERVSLVQ